MAQLGWTVGMSSLKNRVDDDEHLKLFTENTLSKPTTSTIVIIAI